MHSFSDQQTTAGRTINPVHVTGEARDRLVLWIRNKMDRAGITLEALERSLVCDSQAALRAQYRDAFGNTWDGTGALPPWLNRAVAAGQSIDHFRCAAGDEP